MKIKMIVTKVLDVQPEHYGLPADAKLETVIAELQRGVALQEWSPVEDLLEGTEYQTSFEGVES